MLNKNGVLRGLLRTGRATMCLAALGALSLGACSSAPPSGGNRRKKDTTTTGSGGMTGAGGIGGDFNPGNVSGTGGTRPMLVPTKPPPVQEPVGQRTLFTADECPGTVAADAAGRLKAGVTAAPGGGRLLYPYDKTVFPQGLTPPVLQWDMPTTATSILLQLKSELLDYTVCFPVTDGGVRFAIPEAVWVKAGAQSRGAADPMTMEIVIDSGGSAMHLPTLTVLYSLAKLKGAIYYNTYNSPLAASTNIQFGVVMRVLPGKATPEVFVKAPNGGSCVGCHAVSADGSRMVAELHTALGAVEGPSSSYDLSMSGGMTNPPTIRTDLKRAGFSALYPDGSLYVTTARTVAGPIPSGITPDNVPGTFGPEDAKLYDTKTGSEVAGSGVDARAFMPTFAVDGTKLIFTAMDAGSGGHALKMMDFDRATTQFTNPREIFRDATQYVGWPFFMPDVVEQPVGGEVMVVPKARGKRAVFALGGMPDWGAQSPLNPLGAPHPSDLWWIDIDSGMPVKLFAANGLDEMGGITLPYGATDAHKNYYPTISPVAAGGYFWMIFTSKRNYGNLMVNPDPTNVVESKKIWVAAIDINAPPGSDPSHPAFYLDGQELASGNIRGFAALEPCRENASMCETGIDCCCGFCIAGTCACQPPDKCSELDEKCRTAADCCPQPAGATPLQCVGGFCGYVPPLE